MKKKFITVYDYDSGGVWQYINAETEKQIKNKYPLLTVLESFPDWWTGNHEELREYDIDDDPDDFMKNMRHVST